MNPPNLDRIIETFVPIEIATDATVLQVWQDYLGMLRTRIAPMVRGLFQAGEITWYCFLVHNKESGVPTTDDGYYVHLRMCLTNGVREPDFISQLPEFCRYTRKMTPPIPPSLDNVDIQSLSGGQVEQGWKVMGECSEWVLNMLDSHDSTKKIPPQNIAQLLHYLGNQLFVSVVQIPMP